MLCKKPLVSGVTLALFLLSPLAQAKFFWEKEEEKVRNTYFSAAYGSFKSDGDDIDVDDRYYEFGIGAKLSKHFGVEATYADFGQLEGDYIKADISGFTANIIGYFPITDYANMYLKGGIFFGELDLKAGRYSTDFKDEQPTLGVGFNVEVSDPLTLFAEFTYYSISVDKDELPERFSQEDYEVNTLKIGAKLMF